jgi:hypothetical protein
VLMLVSTVSTVCFVQFVNVRFQRVPVCSCDYADVGGVRQCSVGVGAPFISAVKYAFCLINKFLNYVLI